MANLRVAELDFDQIKTNLKAFLKAQSEFSDYDFEGSSLSVLVDLLAYNTHYNAYYANMVMNEMFLDSAVKRESAVSIAKHLGYTPRSTTAATAMVDITVNSPTGSPATLTLDSYTPFTSTINGTSYKFVNLDSITIQPSGGVYTFSDVSLYEGEVLSFNYTVSNPGPAEKYEIPNDTVDTRTLKVKVQASSSDSTTTVYTLADDVSLIDNTSTVYFLEESPLGRYQIYFGDGVLGKKLTAGNIVTIEYISTNGSASNVSGTVSQDFALSTDIEGNTDVDVVTTSNSTGGAAKEDIVSIKFNAPKFGAAQNRAVTQNDYEAIIKSKYPLAESVSVWGGEDNDPPIYGKVLISLKPYEGYVISTSTKEAILADILQDKKVLGVQPQFVDPEYFYVRTVTDVKYNSRLTTKSASQIQSLVSTAITNYFKTDLQQFNKSFNASKLSSNILEADSSIISVLPELYLQKRIVPTLYVTNSYTGDTTIKFNNKVHPNSLKSTRFFVSSGGVSVPVFIQDRADATPPDYNGTGTLSLINAETGATVSSGIGSTNYATGVVTINSLVPIGYPAGVSDIRLTCELPIESFNLTPTKNGIIVQDDSTLSPLTNSDAGTVINVTAVIE